MSYEKLAADPDVLRNVVFLKVPPHNQQITQ